MNRDTALNRILEVAADQGGYVTAAQAARQGVDRFRMATLVPSGDLRRVRFGVYGMRHARHRLEDTIAAWLSIDREAMPWERWQREVTPPAVISHESAASIHGIGTILPGLPSLTIARRRVSRGIGMELHTAVLGSDDWQWLRIEEGLSVPITSAERTISDLAAVGVEEGYLERAQAEIGVLGPGDLDPGSPQRARRPAHPYEADARS